MLAYLGTSIGTIDNGGRAVARCPKAPEIGDKVADGTGRVIGRVSKVFGPVDNPYISIRLEDGARLRAGSDVYKGGTNNGNRKKGRKRGDNGLS